MEVRKRKTFRFNEKENKMLDSLAEELNLTRTATIIRALRLYRKLLDEGKIKVKKH